MWLLLCESLWIDNILVKLYSFNILYIYALFQLSAMLRVILMTLTCVVIKICQQQA